MPAFDLSLNPSQLELILKPGVTIIHTYEITNNTYQNLSLSVSVDPWQPKGSEGFVSYDQIPANPYLSFSLSNADLKLNQTFILPPQTSRQLILKIKSDPLTPLGDSYYTLFINQNTSDIVGDLTHSAATAKIGSHILISSANTDQLPQKAFVKNLTVIPKFKDILFTPLQVSAQIQNITDYYFPILGTLTVSKNNLQIKQFNLSPNNVLAHHSRQLQHSLSPPFWPGKYTATINTPFSPPTSVSFYIFPFSLVGLLIPLTLLVLLFSRRNQKRSNPPIKITPLPPL